VCGQQKVLTKGLLSNRFLLEMVKMFHGIGPRSDPEEGSTLSNLPLRRVWPNRNAADENSLRMEASRLGL